MDCVCVVVPVPDGAPEAVRVVVIDGDELATGTGLPVEVPVNDPLGLGVPAASDGVIDCVKLPVELPVELAVTVAT